MTSDFKRLTFLFLCFVSTFIYAQEGERNDTIFTVVDVQPEYPGGMQQLALFMQKNLHYPSYMRKTGITGKVFVQFVVEKNGQIDSVRINKSVHPSVDEEALRVVKLFPHWIPAQYKGRPVRARFIFPIMFSVTGMRDIHKEYTWFPGSVVKRDGTIVHGFVQHDSIYEVFWFKNEVETITLTPKTIISFEYTDSISHHQFSYTSVTLVDPENGHEGRVFTQMLREFPSFALLSLKTESAAMPGRGREVLFIFTPQRTEPYCTTAHNNEEKLVPYQEDSKHKEKYNDVLERQMDGLTWKNLLQYAETMNLSFTKRRDLLKILDHYSSLIQH